MSRKNKHRLSMDIPVQLFEIIKNKSEQRYCSITQWIIQAISLRIMSESHYEETTDDKNSQLPKV